MTLPPTSSPAALSRRATLAGALWGAPAVAVASAAPAFANSTCALLAVTIPAIPPATSAPNGAQRLALGGTDQAGNSYVFALTSSPSGNTTTGQYVAANGASTYTNHNFSTQGTGWRGGASTNGSGDEVFSNFGPASGAVVLNQRARVTSEPSGRVTTGTDSQTVTFTFTRNGTPFTPRNLTLDIFDITSVSRRNILDLEWRRQYWDAVHFSVPPTSITYTGSHAPYGRGAGNGTAQDPYRRSTGRMPTTSAGSVSDEFTFASFPSGSTMTYTNYDGYTGWHYISITGISFEVGECAA